MQQPLQGLGRIGAEMLWRLVHGQKLDAERMRTVDDSCRARVDLTAARSIVLNDVSDAIGTENQEWKPQNLGGR